MIEGIARLLFPFSLAVAAAIWAKGYVAIGDGFSAGAVAGLGAIAQYVCLDHAHAQRIVGARWAWWLAEVGLLVALLVALGPTLVGVAPVTHVPGPGERVMQVGIIELHTALLFDGAVAVLVYGLLVATFDRLFPVLRGDVQ